MTRSPHPRSGSCCREPSNESHATLILRRGIRQVASAIAVGLSLGWFGCGGGAAPPPKNPDPPLVDAPSDEVVTPSSAEVQQGIEAIQAGDFAGAKSILTKAHDESPEDPQAAFYLGVALEGLQDFAGAEEMYRKALLSDAKLTEASVNLSALLLDGAKFEDALTVIDAGLSYAPKHGDLLTNRAIVLEAQGKSSEALAAFAKAVEVAPENSELRIGYADLLAKAGKTEQAKNELKSAGNTDNPAVVGAVATRLGRLKAFAECVAVLDRAIANKPLADFHVRRGVCRHELKDDPGALKDYEAALALDPKFAAAHYYAGMHFRETGNTAKAVEHLKQAAELGKGSGMGQRAAAVVEELKK